MLGDGGASTNGGGEGGTGWRKEGLRDGGEGGMSCCSGCWGGGGSGGGFWIWLFGRCNG